ncbi:mucin-5AC [Nasonia vitripennis]|uniref:Nucleolar protein 4 n=1 Tax=Nasonia vitripennis TaxID=7425 RepID=A0A7M7INT2_NASVI|nr:mucin-5AC [Nasonia vitripennis]XP_031778541.1 mucin-5AC [Nasonia vitripennis]
MASATMGLRRRVQVGSSSSSSSVSPSSSSSSSGGKRTRSDNNNSPSQGNLNSLGEPAPKKSRSSSRAAALKAKELEMAKKSAITGPPHWMDPRPYASIAGLTPEAQRALIPESLPSPIAFMSTSMATFVGNAANLGKSPSVSYLDISNMTARPPNWDGADGKNPLAGLPFAPSSLTGSGAFTSTASKSSGSPTSSASEIAPSQSTTPSSTSTSGQQLPKNFPNDSMFNAYQPWVIKTYGDLAKTKTITIKKYARILRTLRGEEVNSAENSKFRFWVKSKGFHIGQPEGYEAKPADRIVGRHAVTNPGLDPPLYVPTQPPHNKALNGAEGTVPPGRVYKKVAIVENFFDIIHAVHVDLEGRPGKHAGQKRTYRTITETYAFLPREAVTRFLLGCTECQRRPRTPSPTSLAVSSPPAPASTPTPTATTPTLTTAAAAAATTSTTTATVTTETVEVANTELPPVEKPDSPKPATALTSPEGEAKESNSEKPREASHPPESESPAVEIVETKVEPKSEEESSVSATAAAPATTVSAAATTGQQCNTSTETVSYASSGCQVVNSKPKIRDEKYNPLSITNLLRKDPPVSRRPPLPIITTTYQHIPQPLTTTTTATTTAPTSCLSPPTTSHSGLAHSESISSSSPSTTTTTSVAIPKKHRILPEDHVRRSTPSPRAAVRPWSPSAETPKCAPIDYSRSIVPSAASYLKHQQAASGLAQKTVATESSEVAPKATEASTMEETAKPKTESGSDSESEADEDRGFAPAAGLIDTNLNLLATIQQLHCQVMLALTERLRPPVANSPSAATAATATSSSNGSASQDS